MKLLKYLLTLSNIKAMPMHTKNVGEHLKKYFMQY